MDIIFPCVTNEECGWVYVTSITVILLVMIRVRHEVERGQRKSHPKNMEVANSIHIRLGIPSNLGGNQASTRCLIVLYLRFLKKKTFWFRFTCHQERSTTGNVWYGPKYFWKGSKFTKNELSTVKQVSTPMATTQLHQLTKNIYPDICELQIHYWCACLTGVSLNTSSHIDVIWPRWCHTSENIPFICCGCWTCEYGVSQTYGQLLTHMYMTPWNI